MAETRSAVQDAHFEWTRYWIPRGMPIYCGWKGEGFLHTGHDSIFAADYASHLRTLTELKDQRLLVLCGEPAMGKSSVIQQELMQPGQTNASTTFVRFGSIPDLATFKERTFASSAWRRWRRAKSSRLRLLIDGVDEGMIRIEGFLPFLVDQLEQEDRARLQLTLVCRSVEWALHTQSEQKLISLWHAPEDRRNATKPDAIVYTLCPLRACDATAAAQSVGIRNPETFLREVARRKVTSLAARPFTLKMLLQEYRQGDRLASTRRQLYENYCAHLCSNPHDTERARRVRHKAGSPAGQSVQNAAARLAAMLLFCGRNHIFLGPTTDAAEGDLRLDEVVGDSADPIGIELLEHTLSTPVFTDRGAHRFAFDHQTMAECLAARYANELTLPQIRSLLLRRDRAGEYVVPQLGETASWLAEINPAFFDLVLRIDPQAILRSEVTRLSNGNKLRLFEELVARTRERSFQDFLRYNFSGLGCPEIIVRLRRLLRSRREDVHVRTLALHVAEEIEAHELFDLVLSILREPNNGGVRRSALASAIDALAGETEVPKLLRVLDGLDETDRYHEIRAAILKALVPARLSVGAAMRYVVEPQEDHFGSYHSLLAVQMPKNVTTDDVVPVLHRLMQIQNWPDSTSGLSYLGDTAISLALDHFEDAPIRAALVSAWNALAATHGIGHVSRAAAFAKRLNVDQSLRRRLLVALINEGAVAADHVYRAAFNEATRLVHRDPEDFAWVLEQVEGAPTTKRKHWIELLRYCGSLDTVGRVSDHFFNVLEKVPELLDAYPIVVAWPLDGKQARDAQAAHLKELRWEKEMRREDRKRQPWEKQIEILTANATRHSSWWCPLAEMLYWKPDWTRENNVDHYDVTKFPGWSLISEAERIQFRGFARLFLLEQNLDDQEPGKSSNFSDGGHRAINLLREQIPSDPELRQAIAKGWIPVIVGHVGYEADREAAASLACTLAPDRTRTCLAANIRHYAKTGDGITKPYECFGPYWNRKYSEAIEAILADDKLLAKGACGVAWLIARNDPEYFGAILRATVVALHSDAHVARYLPAVLAAALEQEPERWWADLWPALARNPALLQRVTLLAKLHDMFEAKTWGQRLDESILAELYLHLAQVFPPANGEPSDDFTFKARPREAAEEFRSLVFSRLLERETDAACHELARLASELPAQRDVLLFRYQELLEKTRIRRWHRPLPGTVLQLAANARSHYVETSSDLLDCVIESLHRLQREVQGSADSQLWNYWNYEGKGNSRKNPRPRLEPDISAAVANWLKHDLNGRGGVIVGREVEPIFGQKTDIQVWAPLRNAPRNGAPLVVIEVKGCWHPEVRAALETQLIDRYLTRQQDAVGLYLVGWFMCPKWAKRRSKLKARTVTQARSEVAAFAAPFNGKDRPYLAQAFVLDLRLP